MQYKKYIYIAFGWLSFITGLIGIFLPLFPTVIFWIIAVWLWSKGSPKLMERVYKYPVYGIQIKAFMEHGVVSRKGKIAAVISMSLSYALFQYMVKPGLTTGIIVLIVLVSVILWLISRPEQIIKSDQ